MNESSGGAGKFEKAVIEWCLAALDDFAEEVQHDAISQRQREVFLRHCHDRRKLMMMATDLAEQIESLHPQARDVLSKLLEANTGVNHRVFIDRRNKRVLAVLKRGKVRGEEELRLLSDYAADQDNDATLRDQCDFLIMKHGEALSPPVKQ